MERPYIFGFVLIFIGIAIVNITLISKYLLLVLYKVFAGMIYIDSLYNRTKAIAFNSLQFTKLTLTVNFWLLPRVCKMTHRINLREILT
jgi:hypothetical protein